MYRDIRDHMLQVPFIRPSAHSKPDIHIHNLTVSFVSTDATRRSLTYRVGKHNILKSFRHM